MKPGPMSFQFKSRACASHSASKWYSTESTCECREAKRWRSSDAVVQEKVCC